MVNRLIALLLSWLVSRPSPQREDRFPPPLRAARINAALPSPTVFAQPGKMHGEIVHLELPHRALRRRNVVQSRILQVPYLAAACANQMVMSNDFAVESRGRAGVMDPPHDPHRHKTVQNPIDCGPRYIREPLLYEQQHLIGSRVVIETQNGLQHRSALNRKGATAATTQRRQLFQSTFDIRWLHICIEWYYVLGDLQCQVSHLDEYVRFTLMIRETGWRWYQGSRLPITHSTRRCGSGMERMTYNGSARLAQIASQGNAVMDISFNSGAAYQPIAVAVVIRDGHILVGIRAGGGTLAGMWEFPGGKVGPGETWEAAAARETLEETGLSVRIGELLDVTCWEYPHAAVELRFFSAEPMDDTPPRPPFQWIGRHELDADRFPPANRALIARLRCDSATPR